MPGMQAPPKLAANGLFRNDSDKAPPKKRSKRAATPVLATQELLTAVNVKVKRSSASKALLAEGNQLICDSGERVDNLVQKSLEDFKAAVEDLKALGKNEEQYTGGPVVETITIEAVKQRQIVVAAKNVASGTSLIERLEDQKISGEHDALEIIDRATSAGQRDLETSQDIWKAAEWERGFKRLLRI